VPFLTENAEILAGAKSEERERNLVMISANA